MEKNMTSMLAVSVQQFIIFNSKKVQSLRPSEYVPAAPPALPNLAPFAAAPA